MKVKSEVPEASKEARTKKRPYRRYHATTFYGFVAPWVLGFLFLTVVPLAYAFYISFTNSDGVNPNPRFIGLRNYTRMFSDPEVYSSLIRTGLFVLIVVPISVTGCLLLALLVNQPRRGATLFRTLFYIPAVVPPVATGLTFRLIFDRDSGAANGILEIFGVNPVTWLSDPASFGVLIFLVMWGMGSNMLVTLAGLQDISREIIQAAMVDGANYFRRLIHVIIPMLSPILLFQVVTGVIGALQMFAPIVLLAPPIASGSINTAAVPESNRFFMIHAYSQFFTYGRFGYGSAMLFVFVLVILVITVLILKLARNWVFYDNDPDAKEKK